MGLEFGKYPFFKGHEAFIMNYAEMLSSELIDAYAASFEMNSIEHNNIRAEIKNRFSGDEASIEKLADDIISKIKQGRNDI